MSSCSDPVSLSNEISRSSLVSNLSTSGFIAYIINN